MEMVVTNCDHRARLKFSPIDNHVPIVSPNALEYNDTHIAEGVDLARILFFLSLAVAAYSLFRMIRKVIATSSPREKSGQSNSGAGAPTAKDPVCGLYIPLDSAVVRRVEGKNFFFCSSECADKFTSQQALHLST